VTVQISSRAPWFLIVTATVFLILGIALAALGVRLVALGGSLHYLAFGVGLIAVGALLFVRRQSAVSLYALMLVLTTAWALYEVGLDFWQLLPRLDVWFALGIWLALPFIWRSLRPTSIPYAGASLALGLAFPLVMALISLPREQTTIEGRLARGLDAVLPTAALGPGGMPAGEWHSYGGTPFGQRYSPLDQINAQNVGKLKLAWQFHTGDLPGPEDPVEITNQVTPLKIGDTMVVCTPHSIVIALDATTGKELWRFDPKIQSANGSFKKWEHMTCRGVSYHNDADYAASAPASSTTAAAPSTAATATDCPRRLFLPTADARLIALNADNGQICPGFGNKGTVQLLTDNLDGNMLPGGYYSTSPPAITRDLIIVGGHVSDNYSTHEASGVIRAFDVHDGHLVWNWDAGNPDETTPLPAGQHYTRNSPNVWSIMSVDEANGLVYLPMGNQTPDTWGGDRTPGAEKYSAGLVALDIATGKVRWNYQFTHHDLWDKDVSAQPTLVDIKTASGVQPAVISTSKQGSIYVLNRLTGAPIIPIDEVPVAQGAVPGDHTSPTQARSRLNYDPPKLTEADMWGTTPFDQVMCRIRFKSMHYDGPYTPPGTGETLIHPGNAGVFDWGGISVDPVRQIAFTNPDSFAFVFRLVPAAEVQRREASTNETSGVHPDTGAPYGVEISPLLSALGIPCQAPPWGWVSAVDLTTGKVIWKHKNGTTRDTAPFGIPLPLGVPGQGGTLMTAGGVAFFGAAIDDYLRAYDVTDGRQLWSTRLPAGGQATPMSFKGKDGRQYIVIMAGGHGSLGTKMGDSVMAYALPAN
jgi:quinoprotein glucose dehydrogenase